MVGGVGQEWGWEYGRSEPVPVQFVGQSRYIMRECKAHLREEEGGREFGRSRWVNYCLVGRRTAPVPHGGVLVGVGRGTGLPPPTSEGGPS